MPHYCLTASAYQHALHSTDVSDEQVTDGCGGGGDVAGWLS